MSDGHLLRIGAVAAVTGSIAQLVATLFEPDWGGAPRNAILVVAGSRVWTADRLLDLVGGLLTVGALTIVGRTLGDAGREWARVGQPFLVLMGALGAAAIAVGAIMKDLASAWVDAGEDAKGAYLASFDTASRATENLFFCAFLALGLYLAALAVGILSGSVYARWLGWAAAASAVLVLAGNLLELIFGAAFAIVLAGFALFLATQVALGVSMWHRQDAAETRAEFPTTRRTVIGPKRRTT